MLPTILEAMPVPSQTQQVSDHLAFPPPAPQVVINRTVPNIAPPSTVLKFSVNPTDEEISHARVFSQPVISLGKTKILLKMGISPGLYWLIITARDQDDGSAIENFLQIHPDSPRYISLLANLAAHYRETSQFSKALDDWQQVWTSGKDVTDLDGSQVVDNAVGDWATFLVTLGRANDLGALLQELNGRPLRGISAVRIADARNALWQMQHLPKETFKCGPYSLSRIQATLDPAAPLHKEILAEESTSYGTSLYQNWILAQRMGLKYQNGEAAARRNDSVAGDGALEAGTFLSIN